MSIYPYDLYGILTNVLYLYTIHFITVNLDAELPFQFLIITNCTKLEDILRNNKKYIYTVKLFLMKECIYTTTTWLGDVNNSEMF